MRLFELEDLSWNIDDKEKAEQPFYIGNEDFSVLEIHIKDFLSQLGNAQKFDMSGDGPGENAKQARIDMALQHFADNQPMDLPIVSWDRYNDTADITNGRHRLYAAYKMGKEYAPAFVWKDTINIFKKHVRTKSSGDL